MKHCKDCKMDDKIKNDEGNNKRCCKGSSFHLILQNSFHRLGYHIGNNPSYFIILPIFFTLLGLTGIQQMNYITDPDYLFTPLNGQGKADRERIEKLFPLNYSENFDPSRNTRISHFVKIFVSAKDNGTMFRMDQWKELNLVEEIVQNVTFTYNERQFNYKDICAINKKKCNENKVLHLTRIMEKVENGSMKINYPIMLSPYVFPFAYGGVEVDEEHGHLISTKSISLSYWTKQGGKIDKERSDEWELRVVEKILASKFDKVRVKIFASRSLEDEVDRNTVVVLPYILGNILLMLSFSVLSIMAIDWVRSKFYLGLIAVMSSIFATITGFGLLMYLQFDFIGINLAIPFLLLGIGLDDQFVLLSAWHRTDSKKSVPERMAVAYSEAAASITITSLTTMLSSFVGTLSPFPAVYYFTLYTGVCIFFLYAWFICLYGGCLALAGYAEADGRHSIACIKVQPKSKSEGRNILYRKLLAGGVNKGDEYNEKDSREQIMPIIFRDYVAAFVNKTPAKIFIILVFLCYIGGAIYGLLGLEEGLERKRMLLDESYLGEFFNEEDTLYRKYPYRIQIVIDEELEYTNPENKEKLLRIHDMFQNSSYIGDRLFLTSWIRHFYRWIERKPKLKAQITDEVSFIKVLKNDYLPRRKNYQLDITFNENETAIVASRFIVQSQWVNDTEQDKIMMLQLRDIASKAPFKTLTFHQFYAFFDQYLLIRQATIQTLSLAAVVMMVVAFIFIPNKLACCAIGFSMISIEVGVIGYMSLWDVVLDGLSMMNLIMCIGFSVDFSAHISYAFLTADASTTEERVRLSLYSLGWPVIQGGISTITSVILLSSVNSYIYKIFFKIIALVIIFGILHAIFLLPVLLSFFGRFGIDKKQTSKIKHTDSDVVIQVSPVSELSSRISGIWIRNPIDEDSLGSDKDLGFCSTVSSRQSSLSKKNGTGKGGSDSNNFSNVFSRQTTEIGHHNDAYVDIDEKL